MEQVTRAAPPERMAVGGERGAGTCSFLRNHPCKVRGRARARAGSVTRGGGLLLGDKVFFLLQSEATFSTLSAPPTDSQR